MSKSFNFGEVIKQSSSDVPLDELARKGFKRVKVLDKNMINTLVQQAVDKVVEDRLKETSTQDRQQIEQQAKAEFGRIIKQRMTDENRNISTFQERIADLQKETEFLREQLKSRDNQTQEPGISQELLGEAVKEMLKAVLSERQQSSGGDIAALKESIESLASKVATGVAAMSGDYDASATDAKSIEALIARATATSASLESNIQEVKVKKAKAGGVNKTLKKLKSLQGGDGDE